MKTTKRIFTGNLQYVFTILPVILFILLSGSGCSGKKDAQENLRKGIKEVQPTLPIDVAGIMSVTDFNYENDVLEITYKCSEFISNYMSGSDKDVVKERLLGSGMKIFRDKFMDLIIKADADLKLKLLDNHSSEIMSVTVSPDEWKDIIKKTGTGEIPAISFLDMLKKDLETNKMKLPAEVQPGVFLTSYGIDGTRVVYEYKIDTDAESVNDADVQNEKVSVTASLQQLYRKFIDDIKKEKISFLYIYRNSDGKDLYSYEIGGNELSR